LASAAAEAKQLYVNAITGSDSVTYANNGPNTPWRTISRAAWGSTNPNARNANEAAKAGDTVIVAAGTYTVAATNFRLTPAYNPTNSGVAGSPITFAAAPGALVTLAISSGQGPQIGCRSKNYIIWDGFTINEANAPVMPDTGMVDFYDSSHCEARNLRLISGNLAVNDNHNSIRIENANFTRIANCELNNLYSNGIQGGNEALIMMYDSNDSIIENNTFYDAGVGIYVKGIHPGETQDRNIIRKNLIYDMAVAGISLLSSHFTKVYQNVIIDATYGINFTGLAGNEPRDDTFANNTIHNSGGSGVWLRGTSNAWQRLKIFNNLITGNGDSAVYSDFTSTGDVAFEHNVYQSFPRGFVFLGNTYRTFQQWQTSNLKDAAAPTSLTTDPRYVNALLNDFRLCTGVGAPAATCTAASPARQLGVDIFDLNGNGSTTDLIPAGAYVIGNEVIGRSGTAQSTPSAPTNLRITP
jgi:hypothetical protein